MAKTLTGVVSSDRADKTIVVTVRTRKTHPIYKKQYTVSKKFMAHDEQNEAKLGDRVVISETRPISAMKRFTLEEVIVRAAIRHEEPVETERLKSTKKKIEAETSEPPVASHQSPVKKTAIKKAATSDKKLETTTPKEVL
jgi:small subunit ribosomal protein S17